MANKSEPVVSNGKVEKWVICRTVHLGITRDSFSPGTVIEHYPEEMSVVIEGKRYDSDRDLLALRKLEEKTGQQWIVPFSAKAVAEARKVPGVLAKDKPPMPGEGHDKMPVVKCDSDELGEIDISATKQRPHTQKDTGKKMEVIRGDESAEDRIARLQNEIPKMQVVRDDSLGDISGPSLNIGGVKTPPPGKEAQIHAPKTVTSSVDTEVLPSDVEVAKTPSISKTEPVKRGPGRPRKAKQVVGGKDGSV